jgi:hypothetical protein
VSENYESTISNDLNWVQSSEIKFFAYHSMQEHQCKPTQMWGNRLVTIHFIYLKWTFWWEVSTRWCSTNHFMISHILIRTNQYAYREETNLLLITSTLLMKTLLGSCISPSKEMLMGLLPYMVEGVLQGYKRLKNQYKLDSWISLLGPGYCLESLWTWSRWLGHFIGGSWITLIFTPQVNYR